MIRQLDDRTLVSGQLTPDQIAELKEQGITLLVNNRPDNEDPDQPLSADLEAAAEAAGMEYRHIPIRYRSQFLFRFHSRFDSNFV